MVRPRAQNWGSPNPHLWNFKGKKEKKLWPFLNVVTVTNHQHSENWSFCSEKKWRSTSSSQTINQSLQRKTPTFSWIHEPISESLDAMGVGGHFWDLLKPNARTEGFDFLRNKRVAVDLSFWIVQHETAIKSTARSPHLRLTFFRTITLFAKVFF